MPKPSPINREILRNALKRVESGEAYNTVAKDLGIKHGSILKKILVRKGFSPPRRRKISPRLQLPKKKTDIAYIAGLFDGEGCLSVTEVIWSKRAVRRWQFSITNTDEKVIRWLNNFGGYVVARDRKVGVWKRCFDWHVARRQDLVTILEALLPFVRIKSDRVQKALAELRKTNET
jgi:intein/homing endonuclease